ncbi:MULTISPECIES: efflux RND transporter permease subunit [Pseudoalteromonas]|uniref:Cytochrome-c peroxidase n=1 Tax=Pseudoalteromonas amylolytica TaxID=1859457 RepID=A0A1S1MW11_9GAMM|nr:MULTISPECIES: CusA/CzcA family heavy metal efflux RND transporter [Pseudoalteromonas]OHU85311.1 cytochrome-c peroxidase [Pseudoalteromonas sp. JW3]OHU93067.1 cytochrome-c peroxidase [Pseudoalteromonas amylolytica]
MFNRLIDWSVNCRMVVVLALLITLAVASVTIPKLNLDAFPDVTNVQVTVNTQAPGLASEEVEKLITYPIEAVMYALPSVEQVRSVSKTGLSGVTIVFKEGTDIYFARQQVFERLQSAKELIPTGLGTPEMGPNTSGLGQIFQYLLVAEPNADVDTMALRSINDWVVKLLLMPIDGVTDVLSFGGDVKQYQVNINPTQLLAYSLTQQDVINAIEQNNQNVGGWYMNRGQEQLVIRGMGWYASGEQGLAELSQVPLKSINGTVITLSDVAHVQLGSEIRQGAVTMTRRDEQGSVERLGEVVTGIVLKRMGANTKATIDGINQRLDIIQRALPSGVRLIPFYDQADLVQKALSTVVKALLLSLILIVVILCLFLMSLRATLLVLISIPVSIALALMFMAWFGMSANLMSLGGIAIAIGMLVDGSVVMVENMVKHLNQETSTNSSETIKLAGKEVARPVIFAALIILLVFTPLFSFEGVEAKLFQPMAISIILSIISAIIVAILVVPALASYLFKYQVNNRTSILLEPLDKGYQYLLSKAIHRPSIIVGSAIALFCAALIILPKIGTEFVPELEEGTINLRVTLAPSASLQTALDVAPVLEQTLMAFPEVTYALSRIGRPELGGDPEPVNNIEIYIGLKPKHQWQSASNRLELQNLMTKKLEDYPGLLFTFSQPIATRVDELLSGVKAQLAIKLFGPQLDVLAQKGQQIEALVKTIDGTTDVALEQIVGETQLVVTPNRQQLSRYGLSVSQVMEVVQDGLGGRSAGQIINGNERYDIYVRLDQSYRKDITSIQSLRLLAANGAWVKLADVADIRMQSGPPLIRREDVQRTVVVQANVQGRDMGSVVEQIKTSIDSAIELPSGYSVEIGGQYESQQRSAKRLSIVVPLALALIALLLYFAFSSIAQAMLILLNIPLAVIGGVFTLYLSGQYLSVPSSVGFITLFGVAVLNGVVMVESINQGIRSGQSESLAIFNGATSRLRPVLMTALTSALGLTPMLLASSVGAEIQKPLASVVVGGLISSTCLTLFVLPVLYSKFSQHRYVHLKQG